MKFPKIAPKEALKKFWVFVWEGESLLSWVVNVALAFILIKFIVYPGLGLVLGSTHPVVAVVSSSMEHDDSFNDWWPKGGAWYEEHGITQEQFNDFALHNGFNKGDIIILLGSKPKNTEIGDVIVFMSGAPYPIIHRVVAKWEEEGRTYYTTKGDNYKTNNQSIRNALIDETQIGENQVVGKAAFRLPFLGYIKIAFVELIELARGAFA